MNGDFVLNCYCILFSCVLYVLFTCHMLFVYFITMTCFISCSQRVDIGWMECNSAYNRNEYQGSSQRGKGGRWVGLTTLPPLYVDCLEILGASTSWNPKGLSRPVQGQLLKYVFIKNSQLYERVQYRTVSTVVLHLHLQAMHNSMQRIWKVCSPIWNS